MRIGLVLWVFAALVLGSGCLLESASASKKFSDSVEQMNKAARWGEIRQATRMVDPAYQAAFASSHADWGSLIQVADSEVTQLDLAPDKESAVAVITYDWYLTSAMTLHKSVVRQRWTRRPHSSDFGLLSEAVVKGDPRLLVPSSSDESTTALTPDG
jgi:hypothetical protein